jgi:hypothetical protein
MRTKETLVQAGYCTDSTRTVPRGRKTCSAAVFPVSCRDLQRRCIVHARDTVSRSMHSSLLQSEFESKPVLTCLSRGPCSCGTPVTTLSLCTHSYRGRMSLFLAIITYSIFPPTDSPPGPQFPGARDCVCTVHTRPRTSECVHTASTALHCTLRLCRVLLYTASRLYSCSKQNSL